MKATDFSFDLPEPLIATAPAIPRDSCRLLVLHKNGSVEHRIFRDLPEYLGKGDLLLLNNTKVLPARLTGRKNTGGRLEILLVKELEPGTWEILLRERYSGKVFFYDNLTGEIPAANSSDKRVIRFANNGQTTDVEDVMESVFSIGKMPLPPYIKRRPMEEDRDWYQTVYAKNTGSIAAPTAGLHFTDELLNNIREKGVFVRFITLHVGRGTFRPITAEDAGDHVMDDEYFEIDKDTIDAIKETKYSGKRVIAAGTTTTRAIEGYMSGKYTLNQGPMGQGTNGSGENTRLNPRTLESLNPQNIPTQLAANGKICGYTDIFIYPGYKFRAVDSLITNFHLPSSTPLMLTSAFCGQKLLVNTYKEAISMGYRFFSYGDAMIVL